MGRKESDFEIIATFTYPHEALIAVSLLEGEGIYCFLQDKETIYANPFYSNAIGGVKLKVARKDAERAKEILTAMQNAQASDMEEPANDEEENADKRMAGKLCPQCGSGDIYRDKIDPVFFAIGILLLGFPFLFMKGRYLCYSCGNSWR